MEITTIVGIIVAVIIMLFGLKILLKKPADAAPSLDSALHVDTDSQQPVIPRHVRDQLQANKDSETLERVEPRLTEATTAAAEEVKQPQIQVENETTQITEPQPLTELAKDEKVDTGEIQSNPVQAETVQPETVEPTDPIELSVNSKIEKAEISEFNDESSILDEHLHEQQLVDDESALSTAADFIALNIYPERRILSGEKTLKVLLKYGLRFGEMACFHRYSQDESKLLFSVLQITDDGAAGFDLETLSTEQVKGLAFFLALPHSDVQNAFDTMDSISRLIAREIDGTVYDQNNQEFTPQLREQWRHQAIDYRSGNIAEV